MTRSLNALALLASGDAKYLPVVKKEAAWAGAYEADAFQTWYYGYVLMFLAEYQLATGDKSFESGIKRLAMEAVKGQSDVGSWGHRFANPDGRLLGYGMMNAPGLPLTTSSSSRVPPESGLPPSIPPSNAARTCSAFTSAREPFPTATTVHGPKPTMTTAKTAWPPSFSTSSTNPDRPNTFPA